MNRTTYDKITNADRNVISRAMMSILNSLSGYEPEEKLIAATAASEAMLQTANRETGITLTDLRTIIANMNSLKNSKTHIAQKTIERTVHQQ